MFDHVDEAFDEMAFLVEFGIVGNGLGTGMIRRNHSNNAVGVEVRSVGVVIEGRVGDQDVEGQPVNERFGRRNFVRLARAEAYLRRAAEGRRRRCAAWCSARRASAPWANFETPFCPG